MTFLCILFWMYFVAFLCILRTNQVNTKYQEVKTRPYKQERSILTYSHFFFKKSSDYGRKYLPQDLGVTRIGEKFKLLKFKLRGMFCKDLTRNSDGA